MVNLPGLDRGSLVVFPPILKTGSCSCCLPKLLLKLPPEKVGAEGLLLVNSPEGGFLKRQPLMRGSLTRMCWGRGEVEWGRNSCRVPRECLR